MKYRIGNYIKCGCRGSKCKVEGIIHDIQRDKKYYQVVYNGSISLIDFKYAILIKPVDEEYDELFI